MNYKQQQLHHRTNQLRAARPRINKCTKALPPNELQRRLLRERGHGQNQGHTRPASMCAPRGGQRYKPRPEPRRHHLTHAADIGQTSPQRRHQHKARAMFHVHGPQPPHMIRHNQSHPAMYQSKIQSRVALFFIVAKPAAGPNGIRTLRHQSASEQVGSMSASDLCP